MTFGRSGWSGRGERSCPISNHEVDRQACDRSACLEASRNRLAARCPRYGRLRAPSARFDLTPELGERTLEWPPDGLAWIDPEWCQRQGIVEGKLPPVDAPAQVRQAGQRGRLVLGKGSIGVVAVPRDDDVDDKFRDPKGGLRPVERIAVAEERDGAVFEEIAGEEDAGVGHVQHDVVVGVAQPEMAKLDAPPASGKLLVASA